MKYLKYLGWLLALPMTIIGLIYVTLFSKWYNWHGFCGNALVWIADLDKAPTWLGNIWSKWGGHTIGQVVVIKSNIKDFNGILKHEQVHVHQQMVLGIFQPILYLIFSVSIKLFFKDLDFYLDNPFEKQARKISGY